MSSVLERLLPKRTALKLAVLYALLTVLFMVIVFTLTLYRVQHYFYQNADEFLLHEAEEICALVESGNMTPGDIETLAAELSGCSWKDNTIGFSVRSAEGAVVFESRELITPDLLKDLTYVPFGELGRDDIRTAQFRGRRHEGRFAAFSITDREGGEFDCVAALYPRFIIKSIANIKYTILWIMIASIIIFAAAGLVFARQTYRPIKRMIRKARKIEAGDLSLRLKESGTGDELDNLARAFNDLFARLRDAFERERSFNADVAHELRTPLAALRGSIETTLLDENLPARHRDSLADAISAVDRLVRLVNSLLFLSRAESGAKPELKFTAVNLRSLVKSAVELAFPGEEERKGRLTVSVPESLVCLVDRDMILRMLLNLLDNAGRHTPPGAAIIVEGSRKDGKVEIRVSDSGDGIPPKERERVFERFYSRRRGEENSRRSGTGLGLCLARSIARLHGGELACAAAPGGGAAFIVDLPCPED